MFYNKRSSKANVRSTGDRTDDLTDYRPDQAMWSQDNLPEIIYVFDKPANWLGRGDLKEPPLKNYPIYGKFIRDIPILPDHISSELEGWRLESWCRMDPRIKKRDLVDRMPPTARSEHNADLSMRVQRFRKEANVLGWVAKGRKFASEKQRLLALLRDARVPLNLNTTRGISWGSNPYGQRIPVPSKLYWSSCVEVAPTQTLVAPGAATAVNNPPATSLATTGSVPINTPVLAPTGQVPAPPTPCVTATNTPVNQSRPAQRTHIPGVSINSSSSSSSLLPPPPPPTTSRPRDLQRNSGPQRPSPGQVLDPLPFSPTVRLSVMNHPWQTGQAIAPATLDPSLLIPTITARSRQLLSGSLSNTQQPPLKPAGAQSITSDGRGAPGFSSRNTITPSTPGIKRKNLDDGQEGSDQGHTGPSSGRPKKKPHPSASADTAVSSESVRKFRRRWPRAAFGGASENMPQSLNEWIQETHASHAAKEVALARPEQIQPARPSLGFHSPYRYYHEGSGDVIAAPEDFLDPDGVDVGRLRRLGHFEQVPNGFNAGRLTWVGGAEGLPVDYYQVERAALRQIMAAPTPVEYTPQQMSHYLSHLDEGSSTLSHRTW